MGNPEQAYAHNRHNVGFMCLNFFARQHGIRFDKRKGNARVGYGDVGGTPVVLARPQTYMNSSGKAVEALLRKLKAGVEDLVLVHDDLDLTLGRIRIRNGGGSGGHNGVDSVISEIGSADFTRVRVGIGRPTASGDSDAEQTDVISYVLSDFTDEESAIISQTIPRVSDALHCLLTEGLVIAMNRFNASPD